MSIPSSFQLTCNQHLLTISLQTENITQLHFHISKINENYTYSLTMQDQNIREQLQGIFNNTRQFFLYLTSIYWQPGAIRIDQVGTIVIRNQIYRGEGVQWFILETGSVAVKKEDKQQPIIKLQEESSSINESVHSLKEDTVKFSEKFAHVKYVTGFQDPKQVSSWYKEQKICFKAMNMIRQGLKMNQLAEKLNISMVASKKLCYQFTRYGMITLPKDPKPSQNEHTKQFDQESGSTDQKDLNFKTFNPKYPNALTRLPNQTAQKIRKLLLEAVRQNKVNSYEQMRDHLLQAGIDRSLSSIYRYVSGIKSNFSQFKDRNYAMHRKDVINDYYNPQQESTNKNE